MENALNELETLMAAMRRLEMNGEFIKAGIVHQLYAELRARYRGEPVGEYWNLS
jgi:hypothetical protein